MSGVPSGGVGWRVLYVTQKADGSPVKGMFIGDLGHMTAGAASAPAVFTWLQQRVAGVPMTSTCGTIPPVAPLAP